MRNQSICRLVAAIVGFQLLSAVAAMEAPKAFERLAGQVTIRRDEFDVPHIIGRTDAAFDNRCEAAARTLPELLDFVDELAEEERRKHHSATSALELWRDWDYRARTDSRRPGSPPRRSEITPPARTIREIK